MILGILLQYYTRISPIICALCCGILCILALLWSKFLYASIIFLIAGITWFHTPACVKTETRKAVYSGTIISEERFGSYHRLRMQLQEIEIDGNCYPADLSVRVYAPHTGVYLGAKVDIRGYLRSPRTRVDYPTISGSIHRIHDPKSWPWMLVRGLRIHIKRVFEVLFMGEHNALATGLVIGGSGHLTPSLKLVFTRAGILHILAVSGLHIGFVCLFGYAVFSVTFLPRGVKFIGVMCLVLCYVFLTSFRPSVCRAAFMAALFGVALLLQRNVSRLHIINLATILLMVYDPLLLFSLSAQLSFAAVYGIVYLYPKMQRSVIRYIRWKPAQLLSALLIVSCSAQLFVAPLVIHYFKKISLIAPVSNLFIIPLITCIVFMLYIILFLHAVWPGGALLFGSLVEPLFDLLCTCARHAAALPLSTINVSVPVSILICSWGLFIPRLRKYALLLIACLLCFSGMAGLSKHTVIKQFRSTIVIECPDRRTICYSPGKVSRGELALIMKEHDRPYVDIAIASSKEPGVAGKWIRIPDRFTMLDIQYGDIDVHVDSMLYLRYGEQEFRWNGADIITATEQDIVYTISNGKQSMSHKGSVSGTIFDDLITDLWMMGAQCLLL